MGKWQEGQPLSPSEDFLSWCRTLQTDCNFFLQRLEEDLSALEAGQLKDGKEWSAKIALDVFLLDFYKHLHHAEESASWFDLCHKDGRAFEKEV